MSLAKKVVPIVSTRQARRRYKETHPPRKDHNHDQDMRRGYNREVYLRVPTDYVENSGPTHLMRRSDDSGLCEDDKKD